MRYFLQRYNAQLMLISLLALFVLGGVVAVRWMSASPDGWQTDFSQRSVQLEDIISGGMGKDSILPIDNPMFYSVNDAQTWLNETAPVIALTIDGQARAYPLEILLRHQIVNDRIGETAFAVTFCPLCNSAIVYDREVNGEVLRFGVTGNIYNSGFLMWDDATESWWQQFTGKAIVGEMTGEQLPMIPAQVVGFKAFAQRFSEGQVLAGEAGMPRKDYSFNPYVGYDSNASPLLNSNPPDSRLPAMTRVLASKVDDMPVAYDFSYLMAQRVINDTVYGTPIVAFWQPGATSVLDAAQMSQSRDVGQAALFGRVVGGRTLTFTMSDDNQLMDEQTGSTWNIFGEAIAGELQGEQLPRYLCFPHFWFAWSSAYPDTRLITDS